MEMKFLTKAIKALNKINRYKFYRDYARILNNTKLSDWGGIKPSVKDLEPYDIYTLGKIEEIEQKQVQADWNQNDSTASDYIKNRICYEEGETIILENGDGEEITFMDGGTQITLDYYPEYTSLDDLEGKTLNGTIDKGTYSVTLTESDWTNNGDLYYYTIDKSDNVLLFAPTQVTFGDATLEAGLYATKEMEISGDSLGLMRTYTYQLTISAADVHQIDEKFIPFTEQVVYDNAGPATLSPASSATSTPATVIKGDSYYGYLPVYDENGVFVIDFSDIETSRFKKAYGIFECETAVSIGFQDTDFKIPYHTSNIETLEADKYYYFDFTILKTSDGTNAIAAIFTEMPY